MLLGVVALPNSIGTSRRFTSPHLASPHLTSPPVALAHVTSRRFISPRRASTTSPDLTTPYLISPRLTLPLLSSSHLDLTLLSSEKMTHVLRPEQRGKIICGPLLREHYSGTLGASSSAPSQTRNEDEDSPYVPAIHLDSPQHTSLTSRDLTAHRHPGCSPGAACLDSPMAIIDETR